MTWLQLVVKVELTQVEKVVEVLQELGCQATTQKNAGEDSYYDLADPGEPGWSVQCITGLFEDVANADQLRAEVFAKVAKVRAVTVSRFEDQDWEMAWQQQYKPIKITPQLWVYPSWIEPDDDSLTVIKIDPGLAFGTGTHATTRLCMQVLAGAGLKGKKVLDYGCGSGILAICALKLGALVATGVDVDQKAERVAKENALNNGVESRFIIQSSIQTRRQKFDVVVANILAQALIDLADVLRQSVQEGGMIVLSGILTHQAKDVMSAYGPSYHFVQMQSNEWLVLIGHHRP